MHKSANVQGRSRGKLYEATIKRAVTAYELNLVIKKLRVHMRSAVGSILFLHFGKSKKLLGDILALDMDELRKLIRRKLERHTQVGLEVTDARMGGALHHPITHSAQFARSTIVKILVKPSYITYTGIQGGQSGGTYPFFEPEVLETSSALTTVSYTHLPLPTTPYV